ncbi:MAG: ribosome maturation factor RimM [Hydrogenophaga sp.]|uniref:ribosome maturation factor RimM n=1 Tax=Hydrogenophaga sp. TaxID=1904254 RepID=UPI0016B155BC|nr:ribosome maturation factor RimM [Hydrogenophaga sp.]NIM41807.1 ribosome maturation factor RimM [Hydrogenophaga sp.]NIN27112.1 ribosome maturation factor RimM [Hydrogenophaga sp.]NIN31813.1 ribosome maturation factor RimM [Hydrogenophaga sp.]NIN56057.1 ribosome maturation factor RimM [Hydrogenophaga sp.]NIO52184.1 ribosome maturation factor RimM [Hydrogenophaga sp.]
MSAALVASALPADAVELGRIQDAWGIKGWVRIQPHSADTDALFASRDWFLQPPEARFARGFSVFKGCVVLRVAELKAHAEGLVARIEGIDDRNLAESLKGCRISLPRSAFPEPEAGEFYWVDLIGLTVVNREGEELGVVRDLMSTGPTSVLVLEYLETVDGEERSAERMIPFVAAYIDDVDRAARRITADWQKDY